MLKFQSNPPKTEFGSLFNHFNGEWELLLVALDKLKDGVVLSEDVRDTNGRLLLTKGNPIDANQIRLLKIWGVPEVQIQESDQAVESEKSEIDADSRLKIERTVQTICQHIDTGHPAINLIYNTAIEYRCQKGLFIDFGPRQPLPENFKLDLYNGLKTQIHFSEVQLPESPAIISEFNQIVDDPMSSANDIAAVVSRSPSLAALLLKIANSAAYGFPSKIDTLSHAVAILGTREVGVLAMVISSVQFFGDIPKELIDMSTFLRHSLACGLLSRILAAQAKIQHTERLFLAGLLHDIGRLVWYRYFPEQAKLVLNMAKSTGLSVYEIEKECMGISHTQIAGYLLRKWKFPDTLVNGIIFHHRPMRSPEPLEPSIVHMADIGINALGLGHSGGHIIPHFDPRGWHQLGVAPGAMKTALDQTVQQLDIMTELFAGF
ncbi:MAG: HDOD domain-containing protein [Desulfobacterales bacterium]|nr:HDOD domain-containing protein [Desulfobacterales bacterium]